MAAGHNCTILLLSLWLAILLPVSCQFVNSNDPSCEVGWGFSMDEIRVLNYTCIPCPLGSFSPGGPIEDYPVCMTCEEISRYTVDSSDPYKPWDDACKNLCNATLGQGPVQELGSGNLSCTCAVGSILVDGVCVSCSSGQSSLANSTTCFGCSPGKYSISLGNSSGFPSCEFCPYGQFSSESNSTSCQSCPLPHQQTTPNGTSCRCDNGYGLNERYCEVCSAGKYSDWQTQDTCINCPAGKVSLSSGSSLCFSCEEGEVINRDQSKCIIPASPEICGAVNGAIYNDSSESCECLPGHSSFYLNNCPQCSQNFYSTEYNQPICQYCSVGTWSDPGSSSCNICDSTVKSNYNCLSEQAKQSSMILWITAVVVVSIFFYVLTVKKIAQRCRRVAPAPAQVEPDPEAHALLNA
jgi:hypothetical protein